MQRIEDMRSRLGQPGIAPAAWARAVDGDLVDDAARVRAQHGNAVGDAYDWRDCGSHHVKGREMPVRLFEPLPKGGNS